MSHLSAMRLAHVAAGTLNASKQARADAHLESCAACKASLARIVSGRCAMAEIKEEAAPDLGWESIAARVYWSTSSEARAKERTEHKRWPWQRPIFAAAGMASIAALAAVSIWGLGGGEEHAPASLAEVAPVEPQAALRDSGEVATATKALAGLITFAQGEVHIGEEVLRLDQEIVAGSHLSAGEGGMVVQFGDKSAFRLAPHSLLQVRRFDDKRIELSVFGRVDIDLTHRRPGQEFVVVAGDHEVLVRGTAFRVDYRGEHLEVSCTRGKVVVSGEGGSALVPAGHALQVVQDALQASALNARPMDPRRLDALDRAMAMPMLPAWSERQLLMDTTTILEVSAAEDQPVAVDGVVVADGSFLLRTMSGRHQVALMDSAGGLAYEEWVALDPRERKQLRLLAKAPEREGRKSKRGDQQLRREQVLAALERGQRTARCLAPLAKKGLKAGSYAVFSMGVNADGTQDYLNLRDSNLSPMIVQCVRRAIDAEQLPAGPAAGFQLRLSF